MRLHFRGPAGQPVPAGVGKRRRDDRMWDYVKLVVLALVGIFAAIAANYAHDLAYEVNAIEVMLAAAITFIFVLRHVDEPKVHPQNEYMDDVIRAGLIATAFWGVVGFLVGRGHRLSACLPGR